MADPAVEAEAALTDAQARLDAAKVALAQAQAALIYRRGWLDAVRSVATTKPGDPAVE